MLWKLASEIVGRGPDEAVVAGRIYGDLERTGQPIGRADPMIAGVAMVHGVVLATGNVEHYQRIRALGRLDPVHYFSPATRAEWVNAP